LPCKGKCKKITARRYTGQPPREDIIKTRFQKADGQEYNDFFVENDFVSRCIIANGNYELGILLQLSEAMEKASKILQVQKDTLHFMDIGGNIGVHTVFLRTLGYRGITFEPMPANEDLIRSNLCANDPDQFVALFTTGLGDTSDIYDVYTSFTNKDDGLVVLFQERETERGAHPEWQNGCEHAW
jgi:hypothetical protein